ncbi:hypothetical protein [uncultured Tateyamaria sp.]|uniref:hypothetical protein n=1 Tax=uncultured Tateyamaria sp. TaxID=455651 RepID=UPI002625031E|nr:hypothetical protein [uncultured Tateyamaria sp.]
MKEFFKEQYLAVKRAIFTETGPDSLKSKPGKPKLLKPQAIRLQQELNSRRLRHHYLTGQVYMLATLVLWLIVPFLPDTSPTIDMPVLRFGLQIIALMTLVGGLSQAWSMCRAVVRVREI